MKIVENRKIFFAITGAVVTLCIAAISVFGLRLSIDFAGGELYALTGKVNKVALESEMKTLGFEGFSIRSAGDANSVIVRTKYLSESERKDFTKLIEEQGMSIERSATVGPTIGNELKKKAEVALIMTIIAIVLFIAWAFKEVSKPVSSWKYGFVAIAALVHDVLVPVGVFAVLGYFMGAEIDTLFVMALLAILGYSVNDTIVIFDRVREKLKINSEKKIKEPFEATVGKALSETITRSINTSLTTILVLLALFVFGAESTRYFALTLIAGIVAGTYSSIFLAAPMLIEISTRKKK